MRLDAPSKSGREQLRLETVSVSTLCIRQEKKPTATKTATHENASPLEGGHFTFKPCRILVPGGGVEPPRAEARRILSPLRLPVPPSRHERLPGRPHSVLPRRKLIARQHWDRLNLSPATVSHNQGVKTALGVLDAGHNQAAPRTPLESPCMACSIGVSASRPKTWDASILGTVS